MNYTYNFKGGKLECELEYETAERGSRERGTGLQLEPDFHASAILITAKLNGIDIFDLLHDDLVKMIEAKAIEQ